MQQFFLSKTLAENADLPLDQSPPRDRAAMCWFGHLVPITGGTCTLFMEAESRYCVVFHNLTITGFDDFASLFADRLGKEVVTFCQTTGNLRKRLALLIKKSCEVAQFGKGLDYNISADVYDASRHLQRIIETLGGYPVVGVSEFSLGIKLNQEFVHKRSKTGAKTELAKAETALDVFREFWLSRLVETLPDFASS